MAGVLNEPGVPESKNIPLPKGDQVEAYESFDSILSNFVDSGGHVDYTTLRENPFQLDHFVEFLEKVSPENRPDLFETINDEKAYWINTYNALVMKAVVDNPGISTVKDISWGMGIFGRKRFRVGGRLLTLNHIENGILRREYKDPRIHFAINCASMSCPPLGNRIFTGDGLDKQLQEKALEFIRNERNVRIDREKKEVRVSKIFKWYQKDFAHTRRGLLEYIIDFLDDITPDEKEEIVSKYRIRFDKYDWGLNSKGGANLNGKSI